ncbi:MULTISPECIES: hypothetical protein [unclassified Caballeronia]|uniref:hypothetical protein n=1 Tax=unclassified Caballeronia TaxID=2646786 RepID=UPI0028585AC7|nr:MULTISPECIES: hypothetical protein [unclassified Caballeronia]MDR5751355.1 hypothetical protein [Caballeronia sp. LZ024]MDR5844503.1 hypothetical protein [Caballeronia sp. LZ031]
MSEPEERTSALPFSEKPGVSLQTDVTLYLGDCTGESLFIACEGTTIESGGSTWQRALDALTQPSPPGPYPVTNRFTIFVHETLPDVTDDTHVLAAYRVDVMCEQSVAHAYVHSTGSRADFDPVRFRIGDDVVEIARAIFRAGS